MEQKQKIQRWACLQTGFSHGCISDLLMGYYSFFEDFPLAEKIKDSVDPSTFLAVAEALAKTEAKDKLEELDEAIGFGPCQKVINLASFIYKPRI